MASSKQGPNSIPDLAAWIKTVLDSVNPSHGTFTLTESYSKHGEITSRTIQIQLGDEEFKLQYMFAGENRQQLPEHVRFPHKAKSEYSSDGESPPQLQKKVVIPNKFKSQYMFASENRQQLPEHVRFPHKAKTQYASVSETNPQLRIHVDITNKDKTEYASGNESPPQLQKKEDVPNKAKTQYASASDKPPQISVHVDFPQEDNTEYSSGSESHPQLKKQEDVPTKEGGEIPCADHAALCSNLDKMMQGSLSVRDRLVLQEARSFVTRESRNFQGNFQLKVALSDGAEYILYHGDRSNQAVVERDSGDKIVCYYTWRNLTTGFVDGARGTGYAVTNTLDWVSRVRIPMRGSIESDSFEQLPNRISNTTQTHQINSDPVISTDLTKQRSRSMSDISDQVISNDLTKQRSRSVPDVSDQQNESRAELTDDEHATGIESQIKLEMEAFGASKENELKRHHLDSVCSILRTSERDVVKVWPGYQEQQPQKPVFVMMTKETSSGRLDTPLGIGIYRRRYDLVSDEAAAVLNSEKVQSNRLSGTDMNHIREVIDEEGCNLFDKHSNITVINGCSYKSKEGGLMLEPTHCIVIHCLVKGIIPFGEDLFPGSIGGIPTDVREGVFYLGVCADREEFMEGVEEYTVRPDIAVTPGPRGVNFNSKLLMGSSIGLQNCSGRGSIGGFAISQNGDLSFITCAHVFASQSDRVKTIIGRAVTQPADDELPETERSIRTLCGTVDSVEFSGHVGVDAALVKISADRLPIAAHFIWAPNSDLKSAGFNVPPNFNNGTILTVKEVENRLNDTVVKFGSSTGVTKGRIHLNGSMVRVSNPILWNDTPCTIFQRQIEILPALGQSSTFFNFGDSGALVFMLSEGGHGLHCIGMAIGYTSANTCVVTPIEDVFRGLGFPAGQQFHRF